MTNKNINKDTYFKRQTTLKEIGTVGQNKLQEAKIAIIGCGGLGSTASVFLAGSGIGHIKLIDFDRVNLSNLHRQPFFSLQDLDKPKAVVLGNYIKKITPFTTVITDTNAIDKQRISESLKGYSVILDCTDNLSIKYLINDYCVLKDKTLIYGSLFKFDGYVATFNHWLNEKRTANLRDAFPKIPKQHVPNCSETGILNPIVGIIALQQANETLKLITGIGELLVNQILICNSLNNEQFRMKFKPCNPKEKIQLIFEKESYDPNLCDFQINELVISKNELLKILDDDSVEIISVIEDVNTDLPFQKVTKIPFSNLKIKPIKPEKHKKYILICNKGITSYKAVLLQKEFYPEAVFLSLINGIDNF